MKGRREFITLLGGATRGRWWAGAVGREAADDWRRRPHHRFGRGQVDGRPGPATLKEGAGSMEW